MFRFIPIVFFFEKKPLKFMLYRIKPIFDLIWFRIDFFYKGITFHSNKKKCFWKKRKM